MNFFIRTFFSKKGLLQTLLLLTGLYAFPDTRIWTGAAGDGRWASSLNWDQNRVPVASDDVVLDNSVQTDNYTVTLPDIPMVVKTLSIKPAHGKSIECILPVTNLNTATSTAGTVAALTITGPGYGLLIDSGGVFRNASNVSSGDNLVVADSIGINNGGKYIHQTRASHADNIVRLLSTSLGTQKGVFEFNVPGTASYTISASNRNYGTVIFSAVAAMATKTYTCNGSNPLTIRGDLQINSSTNFNVNLGGAKGNINIAGSLIQNGGIFNIASGAANTTIVYIGRNLQQAPGAEITETNTGIPSIEMNGNSLQHISVLGTIANSINFRMNNSAGSVLDAPLLLPYQLQLIKGKIKTSASNLLTLGPAGGITADSVSSDAYIDGPIRKQNINSTAGFLFPVGKDPELRWIELKNCTGTYTVEFLKENPQFLSATYGPGIDHISKNECWSVQADASPVPVSNIELSFNTPSSGGVTDMGSLRVAALTGSSWIDAGRVGVTGSAGASGSIISAPVFNFGSPSGYFTLASNLPTQNPLPVQLESFSAAIEGRNAILNWKVGMPAEADHFDIYAGTDGLNFLQIGTIAADGYLTAYQFSHQAIENKTNYFRLKIFEKNGHSFSSKIITVNADAVTGLTMELRPTILESGMTTLRIVSSSSAMLHVTIISAAGNLVKEYNFKVNRGVTEQLLNFVDLAKGVYQLIALDDKKRMVVSRFIK